MVSNGTILSILVFDDENPNIEGHGVHKNQAFCQTFHEHDMHLIK